MSGMKAFVFCVGLVFFAVASVCAAAQRRGGDASQVERGREVYNARCTRCHGADGAGRTRMGETVEAPDMTDPAWQSARSNARMIASVANGRGQMPAFKQRLSKQEIAAAVAYVRTLRR